MSFVIIGISDKLSLLLLVLAISCIFVIVGIGEKCEKMSLSILILVIN